ncbi:hypothetical protein EJB05_38600 [Eragrostis curvula]|uniref:DUF1618 domain-containing protein n=1 Tax=Eragrostis curvula TaxID=38414 RepID=A0A5J9TW88_9POAL|nr:hypothetical protein EJB05_38600 [Eragrostis curvula]
MLGFVFNDNNPDAARFVLTSSFRPRTPDHADLVALDARHGRVLLYRSDELSFPKALVVWNPITDQQRELPFPKVDFIYWNAAVLCAAAARGSCDHLGCCNGGPFLIAFVGSTCEGIAFASTYSSEAAAWSDTINGVEPNIFPQNEKPAALVGNKLYFAPFQSKDRILEFDLDHRQLSSIKPPHGLPSSSVLMPADGGRLGFTGIYGIGPHLILWTRKAGSDGTLAWEPRIGFDLTGRFYSSQLPPAVVGYAYAESLGAILLRTDAGVLAIDFRTGRNRRVSRRILNSRFVIPYMSFYTPVLS